MASVGCSRPWKREDFVSPENCLVRHFLHEQSRESSVAGFSVKTKENDILLRGWEGGYCLKRSGLSTNGDANVATTLVLTQEIK